MDGNSIFGSCHRHHGCGHLGHYRRHNVRHGIELATQVLHHLLHHQQHWHKLQHRIIIKEVKIIEISIKIFYDPNKIFYDLNKIFYDSNKILLRGDELLQQADISNIYLKHNSLTNNIATNVTNTNNSYSDRGSNRSDNYVRMNYYPSSVKYVRWCYWK